MVREINVMFYHLYYGDNLELLKKYISDKRIDLIYIDPPFNSGRVQSRGEGNTKKSYSDKFINSEEFISFLRPRIEELYRVLDDHGSLFFHIDYREVHYCKILLDEIFGRDNFQREIIWAYDYGGRSKTSWSAKHDNILWYTKDKKNYIFNYDEMDRIPYMAPGLVGKEKAARGKTPTDVWWHTIVPTNGKEKTGYPTQKPIGILQRIVKVHSNKGQVILDCFAGSGTTGYTAAINERSCILMDNNPEAIQIILDRLHDKKVTLLPTNVDI